MNLRTRIEKQQIETPKALIGTGLSMASLLELQGFKEKKKKRKKKFYLRFFFLSRQSTVIRTGKQ